MTEFDTVYISHAYEQAKKYAMIRRLVFFLAEENDDRINYQTILEHCYPYNQYDAGIQFVATQSILAPVNDNGCFDNAFNPVDDRIRPQWEVIAQQLKSGEAIPPIKVFQIGRYYFVEAGQTTVSVCRYFAISSINAHVTRIDSRKMIRDTAEMRMLAI